MATNCYEISNGYLDINNTLSFYFFRGVNYRLVLTHLVQKKFGNAFFQYHRWLLIFPKMDLEKQFSKLFGPI